jgi:hypothetical protein
MTGGAYAAGKYVITSTKQISPSVLKSLKGASGKAGAQGASGPAGQAGGVGATGPQGAAGAAGAKGPQGEPGEAGKPGEKGATGSPWTAGGTLPSGATEVGVWSQRFENTLEATGNVDISFQIPLPLALAQGHAHYVTLEEANKENGKQAPAECAGTASAPKASKGTLCLYEGFSKVAAIEPTPTINIIGIVAPTNLEGASRFETGTSGAIALVRYEEGPTEGAAYIQGSWAVTAS